MLFNYSSVCLVSKSFEKHEVYMFLTFRVTLSDIIIIMASLINSLSEYMNIFLDRLMNASLATSSMIWSFFIGGSSATLTPQPPSPSPPAGQIVSISCILWKIWQIVCWLIGLLCFVFKELILLFRHFSYAPNPLINIVNINKHVMFKMLST